MLKRIFRYILFLAIIFSWQSCKEDDPSVNSSRLRIKLTDATATVLSEFHLDIREISVFLLDLSTNEGEWVSLDFSGRTYDILTLTNGKMVQMVDQYVPAGTELQKIKLLFGGGSSITLISETKKEEIPLHIPPELQDGLEIDAVNMEMRLNTISSMVIDVNAAFSFVESDGTYFLTPMVRAFPETFGGKLKGYVAPLIANPLVAIVYDKDTLFSLPVREKQDDRMAMFQFVGLKEGEWEIHVLADPQTAYLDTVFNFTVEAGKTNSITPSPIQLKTPSVPDPDPDPEPEE